MLAQELKTVVPLYLEARAPNVNYECMLYDQA